MEVARAVCRVGARRLCSSGAAATHSTAGRGAAPGPAVEVQQNAPRVGLIETMLKARVHCGHAPGYWNPKMAPFIAGQRAEQHVIDLNQSALAMEKALHLIRGVVDAKGSILFVNTRLQFETITRRAAIACGEYFVTRKWVGGTLTNSDEVLGITRKPDLVIAMSLPVLNAALRDANQLCIPTIGIADTDCDPNSVTIAIPGNDDSEASIKLYLDLMCNAIIDVKERREPTTAARQSGETEKDFVSSS